jgi:putative aldouronate transport system substrate-binding protein
MSFASGSTEEDSVPSADTFVLANGPWDLAEGRIDPDEQPADPYFQYVQKATGIAPLTISWEWEGQKGFLQGLRLHLASGEMPDAIRGADLTLAQELIDGEKLIPLDDLLKEHAPQTYEAVGERMWNLIRSYSPDGKIYFIPNLQDPLGRRTGFIREDWLDRVGMDVPETRDELVEVYRAFVAEDANGNGDPNDEIPVSGREGMRWLDDLYIMHGVKMWEGYPQFEWDEETQSVVNHQVSQEMRESVEFLRFLVAEGLMDETMPIQKKQDWVAKVNAGRVGHYFHVVKAVHNYSAFNEEDPDASFTFLPMMQVGNAERQKHIFIPVSTSYIALMVTEEASNPGRILEWFEWATTTKEGMEYNKLGIPGKDWEPDGEGYEILSDGTPSWKYASQNSIYYSEALTQATPEGDVKVEAMQGINESGTESFANVGMPVSLFEGYEDFLPNKATLYQEYTSKIILGLLPMEAWDEYVAEWNRRGGDEVTQRVAEWYKATYRQD